MEDIIRMLHESWFRNELYEASKEEQVRFIAEVMKAIADVVEE